MKKTEKKLVMVGIRRKGEKRFTLQSISRKKAEAVVIREKVNRPVLVA